jgi:hypothetical protein
LERAPELDAVSCYASFFEDELSLEPVDYVVPYNLDPVLITLENRAGVASSMFRRTVFDSLSYDEWLWSFEDWSFWWSLAASGRRGAVIPEVLFHYRRRPGSMVKGVNPGSWARLMEHIADGHADLLRANAVEVYGLTMSSFVATRAELAAERSATRGDASAAQAEAYYREVVALRSGRTATAMGALRRLAARARRPLRPATFDVEVRPAVGDRAEIWCCGARVAGSGVYVPGRPVAGWDERPVDHPLLQRALVSTTPGARLRFRAPGDRLGLCFLTHAYTTAVEIVVGARVVRVDLASPDRVAYVELSVARDGTVDVGPSVAALG